jgi:Uncharacterized conserved protein
MKQPKFTFDDVKFAGGPAIFKRAMDLYQSGKVGQISEEQHNYTATVQGTHLYTVNISMTHMDKGYCTCYMGQNDMLCKHILALALAVLNASGKMEHRIPAGSPSSDLNEIKPIVTAALNKLRPYHGPSRI